MHLEMQDISNHSWQYQAPKEVYTNPATFMGIPNQEGISVIYYGTPIPPAPTQIKKKKFPWAVYTNKIRKRNLTK